MGKKIEIEVVAGLCKLTFNMGASTGRGDTDPGVGFEAIARYASPQRDDGTWRFGCGVISRTDAALLRDELEIFLKAHERGEAA